jgi:hypothetical protein
MMRQRGGKLRLTVHFPSDGFAATPTTRRETVKKKNLRVLVVEDEALLAMALEETVAGLQPPSSSQRR